MTGPLNRARIRRRDALATMLNVAMFFLITMFLALIAAGVVWVWRLVL